MMRFSLRASWGERSEALPKLWASGRPRKSGVSTPGALATHGLIFINVEAQWSGVFFLN